MARKPKKPTRIITTIAMIVARLHISYDRGTARNNAPDLGLDSVPEKTSDGTGLVRGLGSHYRSEEARTEAKRLAKEEARVRTEFRRSFMAAAMAARKAGAESARLSGLAPNASTLNTLSAAPAIDGAASAARTTMAANEMTTSAWLNLHMASPPA
ncbi:hypothetical protein LCGC14_2736740 [marine sediment metagenome]|uniref:Uncharacterized protein n=1 Tax=marine sediment metagenome TaxID=412755 RepID=A0A0F9BXB7_9ZZZZ